MLLNIVVGILVIILTVFIQGFGTLYLIKRFDIYRKVLNRYNFNKKSLQLLIFAASSLILLHLIQVVLWAIVFLSLPEINEFETFESAIYFSLVTFTTLGYGDITIASGGRILAGLEAMSGIMLIGWSTALMFAVFREVIKKSIKDN